MSQGVYAVAVSKGQCVAVTVKQQYLHVGSKCRRSRLQIRSYDNVEELSKRIIVTTRVPNNRSRRSNIRYAIRFNSRIACNDYMTQ